MQGGASLKRIAFVTWRGLADLSEDDRAAIAPLRDRGIVVEPTVWSDANVDWTQYVAVVLRSTWDYSDHHDEFLAWLDRMESARIPLWNPVELVRWNLRKTYLRELSHCGVRIPDTVWLGETWPEDMASMLREKGWRRAVAKPLIAHSAKGVFLAREDGGIVHPDGSAPKGSLPNAKDYFIQEFLPEIETTGEWSLVFFRGSLSHAVLKKPARRDFRVQEEHGGSQSRADPPPELLDQAAGLLQFIPKPWLYARVDGVVRDGLLLVLEVELIEPTLFLAYSSQAVERFAQAILDVIGRAKWTEANVAQ